MCNEDNNEVMRKQLLWCGELKMVFFTLHSTATLLIRNFNFMKDYFY